MSNRYMVCLITICVMLILGGSLQARKDRHKDDRLKDFTWDEITAETWQAGAEFGDTVSAVMLFERIEVNDRELLEDECYRRLYRRVLILSEDGHGWADVQVPFIDYDQEILGVRGRTVLPSGDTIALDPSQIHEKLVVRAGGEEITQTSFSLPGVTDSCIVEYVVTYGGSSPMHGWLIHKSIPLKYGEYYWKHADLSSLRVDWEQLWRILGILGGAMTPNYLWIRVPKECYPKEREHPLIQEKHATKFYLTNLAAFEDEPMSLPEGALKAQLVTYYGTREQPFIYWERSSRNIAKFIEEYEKKKGKLDDILEELEEIADPEQQKRQAYTWVQANIHNTAYLDQEETEERRGKRRRRQKSYELSEHIDDVVKHKYGNSFEINALYAAMLKELGHDARIAFVVDRTDDVFIDGAKYWQFDRSVVAITKDTSTWEFLSPGEPMLPYGAVHWFNEGVSALIAGTAGDFTTIPFSDPDYSLGEIEYAVAFEEDLTPAVNIRHSLHGHQAASLRSIFLTLDSADHAEELEELITEDYEEPTVKSTAVNAIRENEQPLAMTCDVTYPPLAAAGSRLLVQPFDYFSRADNPFSKTERTLPMLFSFAYEIKETGTFALPAGYEIEQLPNDTSYTNSAGSCAVTFEETADGFTATRTFVLAAPFWRVDGYPMVKSLYDFRQQLGASTVLLTEATPAMSGQK